MPWNRSSQLKDDNIAKLARFQWVLNNIEDLISDPHDPVAIQRLLKSIEYLFGPEGLITSVFRTQVDMKTLRLWMILVREIILECYALLCCKVIVTLSLTS